METKRSSAYTDQQLLPVGSLNGEAFATTTKKLPTWAHATFLGLLALVFIGLGAVSLPETLALIRSHSVATAGVVESRVMSKSRSLSYSYEVRYVFSPTLGSPAIGRGDFLGRADLWSTLSEQDWRVAIATKQLQVRFDPDNPTNNAPVVSLPSIWDSISLIVLGCILAIASIAVARVRRRRQAV